MTYYCDTKLDAKKVSVTVDLDVNSSPPFTFQTNLPSKGNNKNHLMFSKGKKDGFVIRYELNDPNSVYTFGSDKDQALYSTSQAICPTDPGQWDQFYALCIEDNGMTLVVHNKNKDPQDFGYTLRVIKAGDKDYFPLDPIGTNQNSNSSGSRFLTAVTVGLVGAAVGAAAARFEAPLADAVSLVGAAVLGAAIFLGIYLVLSANRQQRMA